MLSRGYILICSPPRWIDGRRGCRRLRQLQAAPQVLLHHGAAAGTAFAYGSDGRRRADGQESDPLFLFATHFCRSSKEESIFAHLFADVRTVVFRRLMYGGSEAAAAGLHLSMGSLLEEQQRAPQMVSNLPNATPSSFYSGCESTYVVVRRLRDTAPMFWGLCGWKSCLHLYWGQSV